MAEDTVEFPLSFNLDIKTNVERVERNWKWSVSIGSVNPIPIMLLTASTPAGGYGVMNKVGNWTKWTSYLPKYITPAVLLITVS